MSIDHKVQYLKMLANWLVYQFGIDIKEANKIIEHYNFDDLFDEDPEHIYHYNISYWGMLVWKEYEEWKKHNAKGY